MDARFEWTGQNRENLRSKSHIAVFVWFESLRIDPTERAIAAFLSLQARDFSGRRTSMFVQQRSLPARLHRLDRVTPHLTPPLHRHGFDSDNE